MTYRIVEAGFRLRTPSSVAFTEPVGKLRKSERCKRKFGNILFASQLLVVLLVHWTVFVSCGLTCCCWRSSAFLAFCLKCFGNRHLAGQEHGVWSYALLYEEFASVLALVVNLFPVHYFFSPPLHTTCLKKWQSSSWIPKQFSVC